MKPSASPDRAPAARTLRLGAFVPYRLSVLSNTVSDAIAGAYRARFGLSIPEWRVLAVLAERPGAVAADLVAATRMDKVAVSRAVAALAERGLLANQPDARDRRRRPLALTDVGEGVYAEIVPLALAYEARLLGSLSEAERAALDALLPRLQAAAEAL